LELRLLWESELLLLLLSAAILAGRQVGSITPATVDRMLAQLGPKRTVDELAGSGADFGDYEKILDGIASGDARWIALVPRLQPGTDAGTSEALRIAVAEALPKNPAGVLRLIEHNPAWREVCTYPMIEPTRKEARTYFKAAVPAVRAVISPALQRAKRMCLADLVKAQRSPY
jgi:hypothetical protein